MNIKHFLILIIHSFLFADPNGSYGMGSGILLGYIIIGIISIIIFISIANIIILWFFPKKEINHVNSIKDNIDSKNSIEDNVDSNNSIEDNVDSNKETDFITNGIITFVLLFIIAILYVMIKPIL